MTKALLCAILAAAAVPATAGASPRPGSCAHTDPRGDVLLAGRVAVDAPHVDLTGYDVRVSRTEVVAVIRTAAGGTGNARWSLMVRSGGRDYYFSASRPAHPVDDPRTAENDTTAVTYHAYVGSSPDVPARGTVTGTGEVRIVVRLRDYGALAPKRGARLTDFDVWSYQRDAGRTVELRDEATSAC